MLVNDNILGLIYLLLFSHIYNNLYYLFHIYPIWYHLYPLRDVQATFQSWYLMLVTQDCSKNYIFLALLHLMCPKLFIILVFVIISDLGL